MIKRHIINPYALLLSSRPPNRPIKIAALLQRLFVGGGERRMHSEGIEDPRLCYTESEGGSKRLITATVVATDNDGAAGDGMSRCGTVKLREMAGALPGNQPIK
ncbi:unnamed protein product [Protopolystoma xenopodis]|uniref:Uncharacterized protein n=1 Tax=Protopolystoma xenopodis TaxID=117903 RepID=A0A3S5AYW6_9PLAT|nr:unnamed protein product [Protopolystoma xenopodis]